ncbi:MAG: response regulator [Treponema sp.]|nr:response regulator [Treponema sp.]
MKQAQSEKKIKLGEIIRKNFFQLFFVFLSFALMVMVSYFFVRSIVEKQIYSNVEQTLRTAEAIILSDLQEAEVALLNAELLLEKGVSRGENISELRQYLLWQTESLGREDARVPGLLVLYAYVNGSFIFGAGWNPRPEWIAEHQVWYKTAEEAGNHIGISPPYTDTYTKKNIITMVKTLHSEEGEFLGIVGLDLDFSLIADYVLSLRNEDNGYGMLIDKNYNLIVHPIFRNRALDELSDIHAQIANGFRAGNFTTTSTRMVNTEGVEVVLVYKQIFNNWILGVAIPVTTYYQDIASMALFLSILGFWFMAALCIILIRLSFLKAQSEEENREKTSFLAKMSHEIRTPMNSILGMTELIQRKTISSEISEYINILHQSGQNLLSIINDILDFSKIESNRLQIESREYYIASVINDIINVIRPRATEKSLDFFVHMDAKIPAKLVGDDMRIRQIFSNLLSNAVKYTRKGFIALDVGVEPLDDNSLGLICTVTDSGIGIKQEDIGRLFTDFSRLDAQVNQGIEGTGLGLVITRAFCRAMGGDVTVESEYGKGSVFRASITQEIADKKPAAQVNNPEQKRVLFYDWRNQNKESLLATFKNLGINPVCAPDLDSFKRSLETADYDFAFVSSKYAMDCIYILGKQNASIQLVLMVELGEVSIFREVSSIMLPAYSVTLANVLNNRMDDSTTYQGAKLKLHFTAPEAKILIVDDISTNLKVAKELMSPYNMNVHTCLSGAEAVDLVKQNRYDLVFMDHMMPGMDGIEATALIRQWEQGQEQNQGLPIIALTANAVSGQREMFLQNGINDFLAKPIDIQKLDEILEKWLPKEKLAGTGYRDQEEAKAQPSTGTEYTKIVIPGLNIEAGLRNMGGSIAVYFDILGDFCRDVEARIAKISDALENGNIKLYITLVHALKGAARNIGAIETGELAAWLEKSAEGENPGLIKTKNAELLENLRTLTGHINAVRTVQEAKNENKENSAGSSVLQLDTLKAALAEMNIEAVNKILLEYTSLSLDGKTKNKIAEVEQHILMFDYDKAIEKINELF